MFLCSAEMGCPGEGCHLVTLDAQVVSEALLGIIRREIVEGILDVGIGLLLIDIHLCRFQFG
jgi:hypothetical protein